MRRHEDLHGRVLRQIQNTTVANAQTAASRSPLGQGEGSSPLAAPRYRRPQGTEWADVNALLSSRLPPQAALGPQHPVSSVLQREIVFDEDLQESFATAKPPNRQYPERIFEFLQGLQTYLGLSYETHRSWSIFSDGDSVVDKPAKSAESEAKIRALITKNCAEYFKGETIADIQSRTAEVLNAWQAVRDQVFEALSKGKITIKEMSGSGSARGAQAFIHSRVVEVNVQDYENTAMSNANVGRSFDGFWRLTHEILHITLEIKDDAGSATDPGKIEAKLNPLRIGFGLPTRINYSTTVGGRTVVDFSGGGRATYPAR